MNRKPLSSEELYKCFDAFNYMPELPVIDYERFFETCKTLACVHLSSLTDYLVVQCVLMEMYNSTYVDCRKAYKYVWKRIGGIDNSRSYCNIYDRDVAYREIINAPYKFCIYCGEPTKDTKFIYAFGGDKVYAYHESCESIIERWNGKRL